MSAATEIPIGLCQCGCGQPTKIAPRTRRTNGNATQIKGQRFRFVPGHQMRGEGGYLQRWIEEDRGYETPCWIWQLFCGQDGYGYVRDSQRVHTTAHRAVYQELVGPVPGVLELDHLCRVRACVNPEHMEIVTGRENTLRGETLPALNAAKTHCHRGHEFTRENTYPHPRGYRDCRECRRIASRAARDRKLRRAA